MKREIASWAPGAALHTGFDTAIRGGAGFGACLGLGAATAAAAGVALAACGGTPGRPSLPPPEYVQWADADASAGSVPLADADASVDVARR